MSCLNWVVLFSWVAASVFAQSEPPPGFIPCDDCRICTEESRETRTTFECIFEKRTVLAPCQIGGESDVCPTVREVCVAVKQITNTDTFCTSFDTKPGCVCPPGSFVPEPITSDSQPPPIVGGIFPGQLRPFF